MPSTNSNSVRTRPVHEVRFGRIRAAIWENEGERGLMYNVTISRSYRTNNEEWKESNSFSRDDLLVVGKVADLCHTWIYEATASARNSRQDDRD